MSETGDQKIISFSQYAIKFTGLLSDQCRLVVSDFTLICIPYQLTEQRGGILVSFDERELSFFEKYKDSLCFLSLKFKDRCSQQQTDVFLHTKMLEIREVKEKANIYIISLKFLHCPDNLISIIENYSHNYRLLKKNYDSYGADYIYLNAENSKFIGLHNCAVMVGTLFIHRILVYKISTQKITYIVPETDPAISTGSDIVIKFYFEKNSISIPGVVLSIEKFASDLNAVTLQAFFSPELTEIISVFRSNVDSNRTLLML
jgi:hypothetical protein